MAVVIPLVAALYGAQVGAERAARLAHEQWKFEQTADVYATLSKILDESVVLSSELPYRFRVIATQQGDDKQLWILQPVKELAEFVIRARTPCLIVGNFAPDRACQAARWLQRLDSLRGPLVDAAVKDTTKYRSLQAALEELRSEVNSSREEDLPRMSDQLSSK